MSDLAQARREADAGIQAAIDVYAAFKDWTSGVDDDN